MPELPGDDPEVKPEVQTHFIAQEHVLDTMICKYSSWNKMKKAIVWLIQYQDYIIHKFGSQNKKHDGNFTNSSSCWVKEMQLAEKQLIKCVQCQVFLNEISILEANVRNIATKRKENSTDIGNISSEKPISPINPENLKVASSLYWLDTILEDGILGVGGRLENAPMDQDARHPIILPNKHHLTTLIIERYHRDLGHSGREHVSLCIRQHCWIVRSRVAVRRVIGRCLKCQRRNAKPREQFMEIYPKVEGIRTSHHLCLEQIILDHCL